MKASVVPLASAEHTRVELLLPWYVNGTLSAAEREQVEAHLARCTRCCSDCEFQAQLRRAGSLPGAVDDAALGWEALRAQIEVKAGADPAARRRPWRWRMGWPTAWAIQLAVSLSLALMLAATALRPEPFRTLGAAVNVPTANLLVVFDPHATESQIREALRAAGARLVGGPTVTNAYLLQVSSPGRATLDRLREQPGVVQAESLATEGSP